MKSLLVHVTFFVVLAACAFGAAKRAAQEKPEQSIPLTEGRSVLVALPDGFTMTPALDAGGVPQVHFGDRNGQISGELTFLPDSEGQFLDAFSRRELMHQAFQKFREDSVEEAMQFEELKPKIGQATYCVFTDRKLVGQTELPRNEFLNVTVGVKAWPGAVALFTIYSNGTKSADYSAVMTMLRESVHERVAPLR
jgi:hypothetical protein